MVPDATGLASYLAEPGCALMRRTLALVTSLLAWTTVAPVVAVAEEPVGCGRVNCESEPFPYAELSVSAAHVQVIDAFVFVASDSPPNPQFYTYALVPYCVRNDDEQGRCDTVPVCDGAEGQLNLYYYIYRQRVAQPAGTLPPPEYGANEPPAPAPPASATIGQPYGATNLWLEGCVEVSALDVPPSPDEVLTYFQTLPLPGLGFSYQPPDLGLVNLPEIFFTTEPTTGSYPVDIRGYAVTITTTVEQFIWHTGDMVSPEGEAVISADPGAPYPNQTVTHTYLQRGSYPAFLETVWTATYSYDGNGPYAVPGSVTTSGPVQNIEVVEAHPVLTDPED